MKKCLKSSSMHFCGTQKLFYLLQNAHDWKSWLRIFVAIKSITILRKVLAELDLKFPKPNLHFKNLNEGAEEANLLPEVPAPRAFHAVNLPRFILCAANDHKQTWTTFDKLWKPFCTDIQLLKNSSVFWPGFFRYESEIQPLNLTRKCSGRRGGGRGRHSAIPVGQPGGPYWIILRVSLEVVLKMVFCRIEFGHSLSCCGTIIGISYRN